MRSLGAAFFIDLVQHSGMLRTQVEEALGELVNQGLVTSDNFAGLRALITPQSKRPGFAAHRGRRLAASPFDSAGRWCLLQPSEQDADAAPNIEFLARILLRRYGIVFRKLLDRESILPPWRELLRVYWRMEARGEIRGGRFVQGFAGEQFALPDAIGALRAIRRREARDEMIALSAADPLNLIGIILPGEKLAATSSNRILLREGVPVAVKRGSDFRFLTETDDEADWRSKLMRANKRLPATHTNPSLQRF
jgi:ATP-dependent Lhr-like helicase